MFKAKLLILLFIPVISLAAPCSKDDYCITFVNNLNKHDLTYIKSLHPGVLPDFKTEDTLKKDDSVSSRVRWVPDTSSSDGVSTSGFVTFADLNMKNKSTVEDYFGINIDKRYNVVCVHGELNINLPYYVTRSNDGKHAQITFTRSFPENAKTAICND